MKPALLDMDARDPEDVLNRFGRRSGLRYVSDGGALKTSLGGAAEMFVPADEAGAAGAKILRWEADPQGEGALIEPRLALRVAAGASARILLDARRREQASFTRLGVRADVGPGADVQLAILAPFGSGAAFAHGFEASLEAQSRLSLFILDTGAFYSRQDIRIRQDGPGSSVQIGGLALLSDKERARTRVEIIHGGREGSSLQVFRGVLDGDSAWDLNSLVRIVRDAVGNDSAQSMKALLLGRGARAVLRPRLGIETDRVSARHGATAGRLDEDELFYLRSRGLPELMARAMVACGFAEELLGSIADQTLRRHVHEAACRKLNAVLGCHAGDFLKPGDPPCPRRLC